MVLDPIQDAIRQAPAAPEIGDILRRQRWRGIPYQELIEGYLLAGDLEAGVALGAKLQTRDFLAGDAARARVAWWAMPLARSLGDPRSWGILETRLLRLLLALGCHDVVAEHWLAARLEAEGAGEDAFGVLARELAGCGMGGVQTAVFALLRARPLVCSGRPTSAGRFLIGIDDEDLVEALESVLSMDPTAGVVAAQRGLELLFLLAPFQPARATAIAPFFVHAGFQDTGLGRLAAALGSKESFDAGRALKALGSDAGLRVEWLAQLAEIEPETWRERALDEARRFLQRAAAPAPHVAAAEPSRFVLDSHGKPARTALVPRPWPLGLAASSERAALAARTLLRHLGSEALEPIALAIRAPEGDASLQCALLAAAAAALGEASLPALEAACARGDSALRLHACHHLSTLESEVARCRFEEETAKGLEAAGDLDAGSFLDLFTGLEASPRLIDAALSLLRHDIKPLRDELVRLLAPHAGLAAERAAPLLESPIDGLRSRALQLLVGLEHPRAFEAIERHLEVEKNARIRNRVLRQIASKGREALGREVWTLETLERRLDAFRSDIERFRVPWLDEPWAGVRGLPPLRSVDGAELPPAAGRFFLWRQSRVNEVRPDPEAAAAATLIDRSAGGDFAAGVLDAFLRSTAKAGESWALAIAGLLGDDRLVPILVRQVDVWASESRAKMSERAAAALALIGSLKALQAVNAIAHRYRSRYPNVGKAAAGAFAAAAQRQGLSVEELGESIVPDFGFRAGQGRALEFAGRRIEARITGDFKLRYRDVGKDREIASLPQSAPAELREEMKGVAAAIRDLARSQVVRLEQLMVAGRRWPLERWRETYLEHPLHFLFASRIVWGDYDASGRLRGSFRVLEDGSLTGFDDEAYGWPAGGEIGIVHPLHLDAAAIESWRRHLADYDVDAPFPQIERPVVRLASAAEADHRLIRRVRGARINQLAFRGRAEKLGWRRGSMGESGSVLHYRRLFASAGIEVFLQTHGLFMGMGRDESIELGDACFVREGSVQVGSYLHDDPVNAMDTRPLRLGDVPPVIYSEAMGELERIAGVTAPR
jgi:hypothetical protein